MALAESSWGTGRSGGTREWGTGHGLRHHACLLSSGFYWRVCASSASERPSSFRIANNDDDDEEEDWCRFALPWPMAVRLRLGRIDGPRATCPTYLLLSFGPRATEPIGVIRTSYIYGISRNLRFFPPPSLGGRQSSDCPPSSIRFARPFIYRNIWLSRSGRSHGEPV